MRFTTCTKRDTINTLNWTRHAEKMKKSTTTTKNEKNNTRWEEQNSAESRSLQFRFRFVQCSFFSAFCCCRFLSSFLLVHQEYMCFEGLNCDVSFRQTETRWHNRLDWKWICGFIYHASSWPRKKKWKKFKVEFFWTWRCDAFMFLFFPRILRISLFKVQNRAAVFSSFSYKFRVDSLCRFQTIISRKHTMRRSIASSNANNFFSTVSSIFWSGIRVLIERELRTNFYIYYSFCVARNDYDDWERERELWWYAPL